jgi:hypothetical protein
MIKLWRYNPITGYWIAVRSCAVDQASEWLSVYSKDDQLGVYLLSKSKPKHRP